MFRSITTLFSSPPPNAREKTLKAAFKAQHLDEIRVLAPTIEEISNLATYVKCPFRIANYNQDILNYIYEIACQKFTAANDLLEWSIMTNQPLDILQVHIENGAEINTPGPTTKSYPLATAASFGRTEHIVFLIDEKHATVEPNPRRYYTPLFCASQTGHVPAAKALVERGANVDYNIDYAPQQPTPLYVARTEEMWDYLISVGAKTDRYYQDPYDFFIPFREDVPSIRRKTAKAELQTYIATRADQSEYLTPFGSFFGYSKTAKENAARELLEAVDEDRDISDLTVHHPALGEGTLGDIYRRVR